MENVRIVLEYLRECEVFYMATEDGTQPRVRPMSGVCVTEGKLCFFMSRDSDLYHEIMVNRRVEISARHPDKSWISIRGWLKEETSPEVKDTMRKACKDDIEDMGLIGDKDMAVLSLQGGTVRIEDRNDGREKDMEL
ncbi:pyridoxamine 5'-phosphate oxidase family protein [uncultured Dialister sp.]|uniref:pyridoxamine 5'-phosphate oxidase family protein n=1 Tax=uncultured Dialister sp. TaxID=278064 RepID=UPI0025E94831|nr:pyridoxamine 5'-phosphate oxidase family protein [uncultured Dialister sp.]